LPDQNPLSPAARIHQTKYSLALHHGEPCPSYALAASLHKSASLHPQPAGTNISFFEFVPLGCPRKGASSPGKIYPPLRTYHKLARCSDGQVRQLLALRVENEI